MPLNRDDVRDDVRPAARLSVKTQRMAAEEAEPPVGGDAGDETPRPRRSFLIKALLQLTRLRADLPLLSIRLVMTQTHTQQFLCDNTSMHSTCTCNILTPCSHLRICAFQHTVTHRRASTGTLAHMRR